MFSLQPVPKPIPKEKADNKGLQRTGFKPKSSGGMKEMAQKKKREMNPLKDLSHHMRGKPKRIDLTAITPRVAEAVIQRANGQCEMCGRSELSDRVWDLQLAHLTGRAQLGRGDQPWNIAALCGPSVNTGTCHNLLDFNRKSYRDWAAEKIEKLKELYDPADWPA